MDWSAEFTDRQLRRAMDDLLRALDNTQGSYDWRRVYDLTNTARQRIEDVERVARHWATAAGKAPRGRRADARRLVRDLDAPAWEFE